MVGGPVLAALQRGASVKVTAEESHLAEPTLRSWIRRGRESPDGPFGAIAAAFDGRRRPRLAVVEPESAGELPDRAELLRRLAEQSAAGSVTATALLLKELPARATEDVRARTREIMASALGRPTA
jgi:hypothetical protein